MSLPKTNRPLLRDLLLGLFAVGLLAAPLWVTVVGIDDPTYTYDRAEVVTNSTGIEYANPDSPPRPIRTRLRGGLSEDIKCTGLDRDRRVCALERGLLETGSAPTGIYTGAGGTRDGRADYPYVQLENTVYQTSAVVNTSAELRDGLYRIDVTLEPVDADEALSRVSRDPDNVPSVVAETARDGTTRSNAEVDVPEAPVELEDGTHYRVYQLGGPNPPSAVESRLTDFLVYGGPFVGMYVLIRLPRRFELSYVREGERD